jgi:type II secretory pathway component PulC
VVVQGPPPSPDSPVVVIPRNVLDRELGDFASLAEQVTLAQAPKGGFRLLSIRSGSFVERIGLRPGDIVLRIDNRPINAVEDASAAYAWLRVTDHFTVDVHRNGQHVKLRYVVTPTQTAQN